MAIGKTKTDQRRALRRLMMRLLTSAILGAGIVTCFYMYNYLTTTDKLAVGEVEFKGLNRLAVADVERLVADVAGQNILLVPLENYAARFGGNSRIKNADFKKVLPNRVICAVTEREPVALIFSGRFLEVDDEGMVMSADKVTDMLDLPIITGLEAESVKEGQRCKDARLTSALSALSLCKEYGGRFAEDISELKIGKRGISIVSLKEGMVLLLGESQIEPRLKKFFMMRSTIANRDESATLVDLRFDDQIVLRSGL